MQYNKGDKIGYWEILQTNIINPNTTSKERINKPIFYKCLCTNCNKTISYLLTGDLNRKLKRTDTPMCRSCTMKNKYNQIRPNVGDKFGKLTVIADGGVDKNNMRHFSLCKCDCGNSKIIKVMDNKLKTGNTTSCGECYYSKGEFIIKEILDKNNIKYKHDRIWNELYKETGRRLRFDFIIYNSDGTLNRFIEFDGQQHIRGMVGGIWSKSEPLEVIQERDKIKNDFCKNHNYVLIRIPYFKIYSIKLQDLFGKEYEIT